MANFTLTTNPDTFAGTAADDTVNGTAATLNASDSLDGGGGHNALELFGGGSFDISALAQFVNFQEVDLTNITGGASNLTLRNGVDLTVNVDNEAGYGGSIHLADGTVILNLGASYGYTVYGSTGAATINNSGGYQEYHLSSGTATIDSTAGDAYFYLSTGAATIDSTISEYGEFHLSTGDADITFHSSYSYTTYSIFVSSGHTKLDFTGSNANADYHLVRLQDVGNIDYSDIFTASSNGNSSNYLYAEGSGHELDLTRLTLNNKWYLSIGQSGSSNVTVDVDANSLSHLLSISGSNNERLQTAASALDLTHTPVGGNIVIASTSTTGTTFTVADVTTGLHVIGGVGNDTLIGQGITFTSGQRAAIFAQGSVETITDGSGNYTNPNSLIGANNASWTEESAAVILSPNLTISDTNSPNLVSATVAITGGKFSGDGDVLGFDTSGTSITASYDSTTEALTLTGTDSLAHYQSVLRGITFSAGENPTNYGSNPTRTVTWTVNDGTAIVYAASTVSITNVDDAPTLSNLAASALFTERGAAVTLAPDALVTDPDSQKLFAAFVGGAGFSTDLISVGGNALAGTNITASYSVSSGLLSLTGVDTLAHYQQVLENVQFSSTSNNPTNYDNNATRTIYWDLYDEHDTIVSQRAFTTVTINAINDPPSLSSLADASFTEESAAVALSGSISVSDPDNLNLAGATVAISAGLFTGDTLNFTDQNNITGDYSGGLLTLNGSDTLAHYQAALRSITFSAGENPTNYGADASRTITWTVDDGEGSNNIGTATSMVSISNVNDAPVLSGASPASYTEEGAAATLSGGISVSDLDNLNLAGATVAISTGLLPGDTLNFTDQNNISGSYDSGTGVLTLTGFDTLAHYQAALRSISFAAGENPTNYGADASRTITWTVNDGQGSNNTGTATSTVSITSVNDAPVVTASSGVTATIDQIASVVDGGLTIADVDNTTLATATVSITGNFQAGQDVLAFANDNTSMGNIAGLYHAGTGVLNLSSTGASATRAQWQAALRAVTYTDTSDTPSTANRTINFVVNDGTDASTASTKTLSVGMATHLILNGSFSTGDFSNWTVGISPTYSQGGRPYDINSTGNGWIVSSSTHWLSPINGFSAFNGFDGGVLGSNGQPLPRSTGPEDDLTFFLRQSFDLTGAVTSGHLTFTYDIIGGPYPDVYAPDPVQARVFSVNLLNSQGLSVANFYTDSVATHTQADSTPRQTISLDITSALSSLSTGTYSLEFKEVIPQYYTGGAEFVLDDIDLAVSEANDATPPVLTAVANQTDEATGPNGAAATFAATASDQVDGSVPVVFKEGSTVVHSGDTFGLGTHTITASATDAAGNTASEGFTIYVQDTTPPSISAIADQTVEATGPNGAVAVYGGASATDIVDGTDPVLINPPSGSTFPLGITTVTASSTDSSGNNASETFTIRVVDTTPPTLTPIADQTHEATGPNGAAAIFSTAATDLVDGTDLVVFKEGTDTVTSGDNFSLGAHTITASATDASGNSASETFTINVQDTTPPT